jgi:hypothetical protein
MPRQMREDTLCASHWSADNGHHDQLAVRFGVDEQAHQLLENRFWSGRWLADRLAAGGAS